MKSITVVLVGGLVSAACSIVAAEPEAPKLPPPSAQQGVTFEKNIRPIFEAQCFRCHGEQRQRAGLRLDSLEAVLKGGQSGKVVIAGNSEKSLLVVTAAGIHPKSARQNQSAGGAAAPSDSSTNAPRGGSGLPTPLLTADQVGLLRAWVDQGAK